jgi:hypothetical protein
VVFLARVFGLDGSPDFGIGLFDQDIAVVHGSPLKTRSLFFNQTRAAQANG